MGKKIPFALVGEYNIFDFFAKKGCKLKRLSSESDLIRGRPRPGRESHLAACRRLGIGNGVRIATDIRGLSEQELETLLTKNDFIQVDLFRLVNASLRSMDLVLGKMRSHGAKVWGCVCGETDVAFTYSRWNRFPCNFRSRREAARWHKKWLLEEALVLSGASCKPKRNGPVRLKDLKSRFLAGGNLAEHIRRGCPDWTLNLMMQCGFPTLVHEYFEYGFEAVAMEQNINLGNMQIAMAFLRGAARQYSGSWMLDLSSHASTPGRFTPAWYDSKGRRQDGYSESLVEREFMTAFLSGCDTVLMENDGTNYWRHGTRQRIISPLGKKARDFSDFALRRHPDRGEPVTPVALLVDHYHGWAQPHWGFEHLVWGNRVPVEPGDLMTEAFFELAFPGYKMASHGFMSNFNPAFPFKTNKAYLQALTRGVDMRPYEAGYLTPSRWGDIFDVITDHGAVEDLKRYPVIFLLGTIKLTPALREKLTRYVEAGGTLLLHSQNLVTADDEAWAGYLNKGMNWLKMPQVVWKGESKIYHDGFMEYTFAQPLPGVRVLASDVSPAFSDSRLQDSIGDPMPVRPPMVLSHRMGKGSIMTFMPWYCQPAGNKKILDFVVAGLDRIIRPLLPACVKGPPAEIIFNRAGNRSLRVGIFNHSENDWAGTVAPAKPFTSCRDIWREKDMRFSAGKVSLRLDPYDYSVLEFRN
jgi:hypothetical protein